MLKTEEDVKARWKEHFEDLLDQRTTVEEEVLNSVPQYPVKEGMGDPPSLLEVCDAISTLHNNKATRPDRIPAEILKAGGANLHQHIHALIRKV